MNFQQKLWDDIEPVLRHALAMLVTIGCIWMFHAALEHSLGKDAKLFDLVPILYVAHTGDALAFLRFFWKMVKEF